MPSHIRYPFRIFANANLGTQYDYTFFTSEWLSSMGVGQSPILPEINLATGNMVVKSPMVKTVEQIGNFEFGFVYNVQNKDPWTINTPGIISSTSTQLLFRECDGAFVIYTYDATQKAYLSPAGGHSITSLTQNASDKSWTQIDPNTGAQKKYDANGKIITAYDARGLSMTYAYDTQNNLQTITSAAGVYTIQNNNAVTTLEFVEAGKTNSQLLGTWTFDATHRLESVLIPSQNNYTIQYRYYSTSNQLEKITQTDGTSIHFTFSTDNPAKIASISQGTTGPNYHFHYEINKTVITDALGFVTTASLNADHCIETWVQAIGDESSTVSIITTTCTYQNGNIQTITKPNGATTQFTITSQGLIAQKINPNGQTTEYDYDDFDPEAFSLLIKRELISGTGDTAVYATTRYVYHHTTRPSDNFAIRTLSFSISPMGCVTQYDYDANTLLQSQRTYLKNTYPLSGISAKTALEYSDLQTWVATQPQDAITLALFSENNRGQCATLQHFTEINSDGSPKNTADSSHDYYTNHTLWGAAQTRTQKINSDGCGNDIVATTQDAFDSLARLTLQVNPLGETRQIVYDDAAQQSIITEQNGRTETSSWNDAGQILSMTTAIVSSSITRTKINSYDTAGRIATIKHHDGQITYQLYDSLNRLRYTVTPMGRVTEYFYDDVNAYTRTIAYYNMLSISTLTPPLTFDWLQKNITSDSERDVSTLNRVDLSGRLQFEVDGRGAIIEHRYDTFNREIIKIRYAAQITSTQLNQFKNGTLFLTPGIADAVNVTFYDNDSHIIAKQDPEGYVTTYQRNPAGFLMCTYRYATPIAMILNNSLITPPTDIKNDFVQYYYTDARGQTRAIVDATSQAHYLQQHTFFATGKVNTITCYANQATATPTLQSNLGDFIPSTSPEDRITSHEYDALHRLTKQHLPEMRLKETAYDLMGNIILESIGDDPAQLPATALIATQITAKQFDDWGQLTAEAPPLVYEKINAIQNDSTLTSAQIQSQITAVWQTQSLRYQFDDATGLLLSTRDVVPDEGDIQHPAITLFYSDQDQRIVLTIGAEGQVSTTEWHPIFANPLQRYRYATAVNTTGLSGGFIDSTVQSLLNANTTLDSVETYLYDGCGAEINHSDPEGFETQTQFNMFGHWFSQNRSVHSTTPSLLVTREFDLRQLLLSEVHSADSKKITTLNKSYNNLHGHCTSSTDGNGAITIFTFEPRGVLQTTTDSLSNVITFTHDAFEREIKRIMPMGQTITHQYTQATRQLTLSHLDATNTILLEESDLYDAFGNVLIHQDALGNVTQYTFNQNNKNTLTTDANGNTQSHKYDLRGLLRQKTFTNADGVFSVTSKMDYTLSRQCENETQDVAALNLSTHYAWNALAQRYLTTTPSAKARLTVFDRRSLPIEYHKIGDAKTAVVTAQQYDGQQKSNALITSTTALTHTYQIQHIRDGFGRDYQHIVDPSVLKLTDEKILDDAHRLIATVDCKNQTTFMIRDALGNIRFTINPKGGVLEHRYNAANNPIFTAQYFIAVDVTKVRAGMSLEAITALLTENNFDRHTYYFYDANDNERFRLNRSGAVTETRYDLNAQKIATLQYYTPITGDPSTLTIASVTTQCAAIRDKTKDKARYRVLDALGQEIFIITAEGAVTQKFYYSTPHTVNAEIQYAIKVVDAETISGLSIAKISAQLSASTDDRKTYWIVDGLERLQFHVNPAGAVTRYDYDGDTQNRTKITEFAAPISVTTYATLLIQLEGLIPNPAVDNIETLTYDFADRLITRTNAFGKSESFAYDGASRQSSHTTLSGHAWGYAYDGASRLCLEISPTTTAYTASINPSNVSTITITSSTTTIQKETNYDANANIVSITSGVALSDAHVVHFAYNELNLKSSDTWPSMPVDNATLATSLTVRPETVQTISKTVVHNTNGSKCVDYDEGGNPTFYAYNSDGFLRYKINAEGYVTEYQRNVFGECECFVSYATALIASLEPNIATGLTPDIIEKVIVKNPTMDRSYHQLFDQQGNVIQIQRDPVVCYIPNTNPSLAPSIATQTPTKQLFYNTFGDVISEIVTIDQTNAVVRQTRHWFDSMGNEIATVDANGAAVVKTYDTRGREIEEYRYAKPIPSTMMISTSTSFTALQTILSSVIADPTQDHHTTTPRDIMGRVTGIYHIGVVTQHIVMGQHAFSDNPAATLGVTYTYTDDNKIKSITYPDGQRKIHYYDERRYLIATAEVVRTQQPSGISLRPITYYHHSIHGHRVETYAPQSGCAINLDSTSESAPPPLSSSEKDRYHRFLHDSRGHVLIKQDPENNAQQFTHTATGKVARAYKPTTNAGPNNTRVTHLDEKRKSYNVLNQVTLMAVHRDAVLQHQTAYQHDAFQLIAEGPGDGTWPIMHQFDQAGRKWSTVDAKGATVLIGYNAAHEPTLEIESTTLTVNLSTLTYANLSLLMQQQRNSVEQYEFTETIRDAGGRPIAFIEPGYNNDTLVRPTFQINLNTFDQKKATTTPAGDVTTFEYNAFNKLILQVDPAISVTDAEGNVSTQSAQTVFGYNNQGRKIGERDANGHTELWIPDEANQVVTHQDGTGTAYYTKSRDTFGDDITVTSASGNTWQKTLNGLGKITQMTLPSKDVWNYTVNENSFLIEAAPPAGSAIGITSYAEGPYGDMSAHYQPMGEVDRYTHDRHHAVLSHHAMNTDGSLAYAVSNERDFFGKVISKTDGSGSTYQFNYYNNGVLYQELGVTVTGHGEMPVFDSTTQTFTQNTVAMPLRNTTYSYLTRRRLHTIVDANTVRAQTLTKIFDINRNPIAVSEVNAAGHYLRNTVMTYNARQFAISQTDIHFSLLTDYDPVGNRRRMTATANGVTHDGWWTYDDADRVLVNDGQMIHGTIQSVYNGGSWGYLLPTAQGNTFSYSNGLRQTQSLLTERNMSSPTSASAATFYYDVNDQLSTITVSALSTEQAQTKNDFHQYPENIIFTSDGLFSRNDTPQGSTQFTINQSSYNANSAITTYSSERVDGKTVVVYPLFYIDGYPQSSALTWTSKKDGSSITDNLSYDFIFFDDPAILTVRGTRTDQYGASSIICPRYYDSNGALSSVVAVNNPFNANDKNPNTLFFIYSLDGNLLSEYSVSFVNGIKINTPTVYYHDTNGHIVAEYGMVSNASNQTQMILQLTANPVRSFNIINLSNAPSTIVQPGDNWENISYRMYRDSNYASILHAYSGVSLVPGQMVSGKRTMDAYNKVHNYAPYQRLMDVVYGGMNPALKTPQPPPPPPRHHESFWDELIGVVASVVVMIVVPEAIESILPVAFGAFGAIETGTAFAVAGALADAASQGVAIGFNDQHGFSMKNMFENAVAAGATAGLGKALGLSELLADGKYVKAFSETVTLGLTVQLFQMSIGLRDKLDIKLIMAEAAANVIQANIGKALKDAPKTITHGVDELASTTVGAAFGEPVDLTNLAGNYLGDEAGDEADAFAKKVTQSHRSTSIGKPYNPSSFSDKFRTAQTATHFIPANESVANLYEDYENGLSNDVHAMAESDFATAQSVVQRGVDEQRGAQTQHRARRTTSSPGFFNRIATDISSSEKFVYGFGVGAAKETADMLYASAEAFEHPVRTAFALYATAQQLDQAGMHFMSALWNAQTRPEAWMQLKNGIGATGLALSTKYKELSELTPKGLGEALGAGASDAASYFVPGGEAVKGAELGTSSTRSIGVFAREVKTITLYRAVNPNELEQILQTEKFENLPGTAEGKYFSTSLSGAKKYAAMAEKVFGDPPYSFIRTNVPQSIITKIMGTIVDGGIETIVVPEKNLPSLTTPEILENRCEHRRFRQC